MRRMLLALMVLLVLGRGHASAVLAQENMPDRATCEAAVRAGLQALTQQPIDQVAALIDDWGSDQSAAALGLPPGCRVPVSVPAIEPLDDGGFMICLWWNPRSGALGDALRSQDGWDAGWWECLGPPNA